MSAPLHIHRASLAIALLFSASMTNEILIRMYGPVLYPLFGFMYKFPNHGLPYPITIFTDTAHLPSLQQPILVPTYHHSPKASPCCIATLPSSLSRTLHWVLRQYQLALVPYY